MKKKKIVILSIMLGYGGIEKYISSICKMFHEDYDIEIICDYKEVEKEAFNFYNAKIKYLIDGKYSNLAIKKLIKEKKYISILKEIINRIKLRYLQKHLMIKELKKVKCDYIITTRLDHNKLVNKYIKDKNIIKIATEHNSYDIRENFDKEIAASVSNFDYFILVSNDLKQHYEKMVKKPKCIYIPNILDDIKDYHNDLNTKNIISVGRFSPEKGFVDLVKVMDLVVKKDKDIKLYLVGDGFQKEEIKSTIKELNLEKNIILTGFKDTKEQYKYYKESSLYVMTSYSESFGIVLLESMNYGVPCIAFSSARGAKTILEEADFPLVDERNLETMASEIVTLLNDKKKLKQLQTEGKKYITKYSIENVKKEWLKIIK